MRIPAQFGEPVTCPMQAGDMLFISNLTYRRFLMNASDHTHWSIDLRYREAVMQHPRKAPDFLLGFIACSCAAPESADGLARLVRCSPRPLVLPPDARDEPGRPADGLSCRVLSLGYPERSFTLRPCAEVPAGERFYVYSRAVTEWEALGRPPAVIRSS